jgi:hypothetical protein
MKKFIFLFLLSSVHWAAAQNAPIDFEPEGIGADFTWATFEAPEGENNPTFSIVPNILVDANNPSATVAKMDIEYGTDAIWGSAGCETMHGSDVGPFTITAEDYIVSLQFYQVGFAAPVALKFATTEGAAFMETIVQNTIADAWVTVEFDMSVWIGSTLPGTLDQVIFFPSYAPRETGHVVYFDNVAFEPAGPVSVNDLPKSTFRTFPNPSSDYLNIQTDISWDNYQIYSLTGQLVRAQEAVGNETTRVNISDLQQGMYLLKIEVNGQSMTSRFVKN